VSIQTFQKLVSVKNANLEEKGKMKMDSDRFLIEPGIESKYFPEKLEVIFITEFLPDYYQEVTSCLIRNHLTVIGFGWAIENPNDEWVQKGGYNWAYKRAIKSMTHNIAKQGGYTNNFSDSFRKEIDRKMRQALYEARKE